VLVVRGIKEDTLIPVKIQQIESFLAFFELMTKMVTIDTTASLLNPTAIGTFIRPLGVFRWQPTGSRPVRSRREESFYH
jgi:hypothetical protein